MGKLKRTAGDSPGINAQPTPVCCECGWDFNHDNKERVEYDPKVQPGKKRTEPRTQINIGSRAHCDVCYETKVFAAGDHTSNGPVADALYHRGLRQAAQRSPLTAEAREQNRIDVERAIADLAKKWGI